MSDQTPAVVEKKPRAPRRNTPLVVGTWAENGSFVPGGLQPSGKAQRSVDALRVWLRTPEVCTAYSGVFNLSSIRRELPVASYQSETVVKAKVQ